MSDTSANSPLPARYENGRFGPGNPGRRPGARGRMSHRVAMAILEDFMEHKKDTLTYARKYQLPAYLNVLLKLLPMEAALEAPEVRDWSEADVDDALARVRTALATSRGGRDALIELESVLLGEGPAEPVAALSTHRINGD